MNKNERSRVAKSISGIAYITTLFSLELSAETLQTFAFSPAHDPHDLAANC